MPGKYGLVTVAEDIWACPTLRDNRKTVTTAGSREALAAVSTPILGVIIAPITSNTGIVAVGGTTVLATTTQQRGIPLVGGDPALVLPVNDLSNVYIDATFASEGVTYITLGT